MSPKRKACASPAITRPNTTSATSISSSVKPASRFHELGARRLVQSSFAGRRSARSPAHEKGQRPLAAGADVRCQWKPPPSSPLSCSGCSASAGRSRPDATARAPGPPGTGGGDSLPHAHETGTIKHVAGKCCDNEGDHHLEQSEAGLGAPSDIGSGAVDLHPAGQPIGTDRRRPARRRQQDARRRWHCHPARRRCRPAGPAVTVSQGGQRGR